MGTTQQDSAGGVLSGHQVCPAWGGTEAEQVCPPFLLLSGAHPASSDEMLLVEGWEKHKSPCSHLGLLGEVSPAGMLSLPRSQLQAGCSRRSCSQNLTPSAFVHETSKLLLKNPSSLSLPPSWKQNPVETPSCRQCEKNPFFLEAFSIKKLECC